MIVFIMRHGDAEPFSTSDKLRRLTALGVSEVERTLAANLDALSSVEHICVSPYVRAQETATIIHSQFAEIATKSDQDQSLVELEICDYLTPDIHPTSVIEQLYRMHEAKKRKAILLVSHQPLVSYLLELLCYSRPSFQGRHPMPTSALACISLTVPAAGCGDLLWLKAPLS